MLLVTVLAVTIVSVSGEILPAFQFKSCDTVQLNRAQAAFNDYLQIDPTLNVKTYDLLRKAVEAVWFDMQQLGLAKTCMAFKQLKTQFNGVSDYEDCFFSPVGLVAMSNGTATGVTREQANGYIKLITQFDFACGAGYHVFANKDFCMGKLFNSTSSKLDACQQTFLSQAARDPTQACAYADQAAKCYRDYFFPCGISAGWWACEYERIGTAVLYPQCSQNFCTFNP